MVVAVDAPIATFSMLKSRNRGINDDAPILSLEYRYLAVYYTCPTLPSIFNQAALPSLAY